MTGIKLWPSHVLPVMPVARRPVMRGKSDQWINQNGLVPLIDGQRPLATGNWRLATALPTYKHIRRKRSMYKKVYNDLGTRPTGSASGFTLMEILIAILILSVVITTVLTSFNMVFSTTEALDNNAAIYESARTCLNQIASDLEQIHISKRPYYRQPEPQDPPDPYRIEGVTEDIDGTKAPSSLA